MNSKLCSATTSGRWIRRVLGVVAVGALVPVLASQEIASAQPKGAAPPAAAAPRPAGAQGPRDPNAIAALEKMGAYLRSLPSFAAHSDATTDEVAPSGQKIMFVGTANLYVKRPDRFRLDVNADKKHRLTFYDGKSLTQYGPGVNYYSSIEAPGNIKDTITMVEDKYDVDLPLVDLFRWGTDAANLDDITSAVIVGPSKIAGIACDHYAFRQADEDWQVWIEKGATPLPRKLVITTLDKPAQPQHTELLTWDLNYKPVDAAFVFSPPTGAQKIPIAQARASQ